MSLPSTTSLFSGLSSSCIFIRGKTSKNVLLKKSLKHKIRNEDPTEDINKRVRFYLKILLANNVIDKQTHRYLTPENPNAGRFYILPKIHKPGNPGRPIASANGHPTEKISEFVSFHLNPLVQTLPSYVKYTTHLLNKQRFWRHPS